MLWSRDRQASERTRETDVHRSYFAARRSIDDAERQLSQALQRRAAAPELRALYLTVDRRLTEGIGTIEAAMRGGVPAPAGLGSWAAERARLGEMRDRHWFAAADTSGVQAVNTVRVGSRAASGPHIAGMVAEPDSLVRARRNEPRIGVERL